MICGYDISSMNQLNDVLFEGQPVLRAINASKISINTDYMFQGRHQNQYMIRAQTGEYIPASTTAYSAMSESNNSPPLAVATIIPPSDTENPILKTSHKKEMTVTIPQGAGPGSVLTVLAPSGATISVRF